MDSCRDYNHYPGTTPKDIGKRKSLHSGGLWEYTYSYILFEKKNGQMYDFSLFHGL